MTFEFLTKYPYIYQRLLSRLGYYSDGIYAFEKNELAAHNGAGKLIFIVAKAHYSETWQAFSSINKSELNKLIALKKKTNGQRQSIYQLTENKAIDGFDVKTITFEPEVFKHLGPNKILIPETELLHSQPNQVVEVHTPRGVLFSSVVGNKVSSAYAQGIIANINTYKLSAGLPNDAVVAQISEQAFAQFIVEQLQQLPANQLIAKSLANPKTWFNPNQWHWLYGAPLLTALAFYLITNSYLALHTHQLESSLTEDSGQISALLTQKQEIDKKAQLLTQLSKEFSPQTIVHNHWRIIGHLLENGATITRITYKDGELTVRGSAEKASSVLAKIAEFEQVQSASFNGPVRSYRGSDVFVMNITPKEQA